MGILVRGGGEQLLGTITSQAVTYSRNECVTVVRAIYLHTVVKYVGTDNLNTQKRWVCNTCENICLTYQLILALDPFS